MIWESLFFVRKQGRKVGSGMEAKTKKAKENGILGEDLECLIFW